ncbi:flagellar hook-length control protein FliK [Pseudomonas sp. TE3610]
MDITALLVSTAAVSAPQATAAETDGSVFAQALDAATQVQAEPVQTAPVAVETAVETPPVLTEPVPLTTEAANIEVPTAPLPELPEPAPEPVAEPTAPVETPVVPVAKPQPAVKEEQTADIEVPTAPAEPVDTEATPDSDDSVDTQLQHIRDRMHLIDTAGTPDTSTVQVYVAPAPAPVPTVTTPEAAETSVQTTPLISQRSTALPNVTSTAQKTAPAISEDDTPPVAAVPTDTTAAVMPAPAQDDNTATDSDSPSPPPLDALSAWTPTASPAVSSDTAQVNTGNPTLTAAVGSSPWQSGLSQQVLNLHQRGKDRVDLQLHPADLGPLSISLKHDTSGTQAQFVCAHPSVRSAVEQALPQLREALAAQGITLGETSVSDQPSRQARDQQVPYVPSAGASAVEEEPCETVATPLLTRIDLYT